MSQECILIDPLRFADEARSKAGRVPISALPRVAQSVLETEGELVFTLEGYRNQDGKRFLLLKASVELVLCCQRCLEPMSHSVLIDSRLWLVPKGQLIPDEELDFDEFDAIEVDAQLDVLQLLEDECLLTLPMAPRHLSCEGIRPKDGADAFSPFSGLAVLKKQH